MLKEIVFKEKGSLFLNPKAKRTLLNSKMNSTSKLTTSFMVNAVLLCVVNVIFTFVGIILNSVVIASLLNSQLRRKLCYFMILILAFTDIAVVIVFHPVITVKVIFYWKTFETIVFPHIQKLYASSCTALLTMSMERYFALMYPFLHEKLVTKTKLTVVFLLLQLPFVVLLTIKYKEDDSYIKLTYVVAPVVIIFFAISFLNLKLFYIAKKMQQRAVVALGDVDGSENHDAGRKKAKATLANLKTISTCLLVVLCLFICYCPIIIAYSLIVTGRADRNNQNTHILQCWADTFITVNSSLNCLIFFYKNNALRRHAANLLGTFFGKRSLFQK